MNLGVRKEEAMYLYDIIMADIGEFGVAALKEAYGNIDLESILVQLQIIMQIGQSVDDE